MDWDGAQIATADVGHIADELIQQKIPNCPGICNGMRVTKRVAGSLKDDFARVYEFPNPRDRGAFIVSAIRLSV